MQQRRTRTNMGSEDFSHKPAKRVGPNILEDVPTLTAYEVVHKLGEGSFGKVVLVRKKDNGELYALKFIDKKRIRNERELESIMSESEVLQKIEHPYIMRMYGAFQDSERFYFLCEFVSGGDLYAVLERYEKFPESWTRVYVAEIALALDHIHARSIIYRDLKLENVLVASNGHLKLADFGLAKKQEGAGRGSMAGTVVTMAPEVMMGEQYGASVDWWALGVLFCEMLLGGSPIPLIGEADHEDDNVVASLHELRQAYLNGTHLDALPDDVETKARQAIVSLLSVNIEERLCSLDMLKSHPFFDEFDWTSLEQGRMVAPMKRSTALSELGAIDDEEGDSENDANGSLISLNGGNAGGSLVSMDTSDAPAGARPRANERLGGAMRHAERRFSTFMNAPTSAATVQVRTLNHTDISSTAICDAASRGDVGQIRRIIEAGGDVDIPDYDRRTALHVAAADGLLEVVKFLIEEARADPMVIDRWGGTPMDDADRNDHTVWGFVDGTQRALNMRALAALQGCRLTHH